MGAKDLHAQPANVLATVRSVLSDRALPAAETLVRDRYVLAASGCSLLLLGVLAWSFFAEAAGAGKKDEKKKAYTHVHCPDCLEEFPYNPRWEGKLCASCEAGARLVPTVGSLAENGGAESPLARLVVFVVLTAVLVQGLTFLGIYRLRVRKREREASANRTLICHCPFCKRKIGYTARKAGQGVACPRCKTAFALPPIEEVEIEKRIGHGAS